MNYTFTNTYFNETMEAFSNCANIPDNIVCVDRAVFENSSILQNFVQDSMTNTILNRLIALLFLMSILIMLFWYFSYKGNRFTLLNFKEKAMIVLFSLLYNGCITLFSMLYILINIENILLGIIALVVNTLSFSILLYYISHTGYEVVRDIRLALERRFNK